MAYKRSCPTYPSLGTTTSIFSQQVSVLDKANASVVAPLSGRSALAAQASANDPKLPLRDGPDHHLAADVVADGSSSDLNFADGGLASRSEGTNASATGDRRAI
jgi:hypothetical protein